MENSAVLGVEDAELEGRIYRRIRGGLSGIYAVVRDGYVFLSGEVRSPEEKTEIEARVWNVEGVRSVTNHIRVDDLEDESYRRLEKSVLNCPFKGVDLLTIGPS